MMHEEPLSVEAGAAVTADSIWEACINIKEQGRKARNSTMEDKGEAEGKEERQKEHCNLGALLPPKAPFRNPLNHVLPSVSSGRTQRASPTDGMQEEATNAQAFLAADGQGGVFFLGGSDYIWHIH
ncbi:hypothetical protein Anapl_03019 [Anas platyrhynchos]|uniref:Uncharacterized protein n=1 Tax=Anas platyrhynchos TaxID=8839 RepID=R0L9Y7_ANAPL|nr:hypothetical protein Anapl_03019 [Anas platyrhynchos]